MPCHRMAGPPPDADNKWLASGCTTYFVTLRLNASANDLGMRLYKRQEYYNMPSSGDGLRLSTAVFPAVSAVKKGSPAALAGVRVGDLLLAVNGTSLAKAPLTSVGQALGSLRVRGAVGSLFWRRAPLVRVPELAPPQPHGQARGGHVISVVAFNRPSYFQRCLDALAMCRGIDRYTVLLFVEPADAEVIKVAQAFAASGIAANTVVHVNTISFGFPQNLRQVSVRQC